MRKRPSDIDDYDRDKQEIINSGEWEALTINFLDKFDSLNKTAVAIIQSGGQILPATNLHT